MERPHGTSLRGMCGDLNFWTSDRGANENEHWTGIESRQLHQPEAESAMHVSRARIDMPILTDWSRTYNNI